jgi:hypothetical protein
MITKLEKKKKSSRKPYPMSRDKRSIMSGELPAHLQTMALFKVNTGCREKEVCKIEAGLRDTGTGTQHPGSGCRRGRP